MRRQQRVTAAVVAASPVAGWLSLSLMHGSFERACRGRVNMVCVAIGVFVVCNINNI